MATLDKLEIQVSADVSKAESGLERLKKTVENVQGSVDEAGDTMKETGKETEKAGKTAQKSANGFTKLGKTLERILLRRAVMASLQAIKKSLKEGLERMYAWSQANDQVFSKSMDQYATEMQYLSDSMGAMLAPLLETLIPVLSQIVDWFVEIINRVNEFFAAFRGNSTYQTAIKQTKQWSDATDSAANSQKKLNAQLMAFDDLNNITTSNGSSSGSDSANLGKTAFVSNETKNIADWFKSIVSNLESALLKIKSKIDFDGLKQRFSEIGQTIGGMLSDFSNWLDGSGYDFGELVNALLQDVSAIASFVLQVTRQELPTSLSLLTSVATQVEIISDMLDSIANGNIFGGVLKGVLKTIVNAFGFVGKIFAGIYSSAVKLIALIKYNMGKITKETYDAIIESENASMGALDDGIQEVLDGIDGIGKAAKSAEEKYNEYAEQIKNGISVGIKDQTTGIITWLTTLEELAAYYGKSIGNKLASGISSGVSVAFSGLKSSIAANTGDSRLAYLNSITQRANGGFVDTGSLFIANEEGPELVGTIGGQTAVASNMEITGIADAVYSSGTTQAQLLSRLISAVNGKELTISPSAKLGKVVTQSAKLYGGVTG